MWRFTRSNGITGGFHNKMETISRHGCPVFAYSPRKRLKDVAPHRGRISNFRDLCAAPARAFDFPALTAGADLWAQGLTQRQVRRYLTSMKTIVSSKGQI